MTPKPEDFLLQAWKQQLDIGLRLIEAMVEGAIKMRQVQLEAATETHAKAAATRKSAADAGDLAQLVELQAEWTRVNVQKCAAYWRDLYEVATRTQVELASRSGVQPPAAAIEATQKFYRIEPGKLAEEKLPGEDLAVPAKPKSKPSRRATAQ